MTAGFQRRLEGITAIPGILGSQKSLPRGYAVARERDEESGALYSGGSRRGSSPARRCASNSFQTCSRMRQATYRLQYDGTIPKPHAPDTIAYMEDYLDQFHRMKDIFLEFRVTKRTQAKVDKQRKEIRRQRGLLREGAAPSQRRWICDDDRDEENELRMNMINAESHFNFVKMHLLSHLCDDIRQFGNVPMYSTEIGELAHKTQIKEGWRQSNKNKAARQLVHSYGRQHAIRMRLLNLESLHQQKNSILHPHASERTL